LASLKVDLLLWNVRLTAESITAASEEANVTARDPHGKALQEGK
jgi:hypothetical protein